MSPQYFVETLASGRPQFVHLKRSRSHGHHHHHHHGHHHHRHDDCADVTQAEWDAVVERERHLRRDNDALKRENHALKHENQALAGKIQAGDAELRRLQGYVPQLEHANAALRAENESLRRSLEGVNDHAVAHHHEVEKLRKRVRRLERENEGLVARIRELSRQCSDSVADKIAEWRDAAHAWRRRFDEAEGRVVRLRRENADQAMIIDEQKERLSVYERILRRHGFLS